MQIILRNLFISLWLLSASIFSENVSFWQEASFGYFHVCFQTSAVPFHSISVQALVLQKVRLRYPLFPQFLCHRHPGRLLAPRCVVVEIPVVSYLLF